MNTETVSTEREKGKNITVRKAIILSNPWRAIMRRQNLCQQGYSSYQEIRTLLLSPKGNIQNSATGLFSILKRPKITAEMSWNPIVVWTYSARKWSQWKIELSMLAPPQSKNNCVTFLQCFFPPSHQLALQTVNEIILKRKGREIIKNGGMLLDWQAVTFLCSFLLTHEDLSHFWERKTCILRIKCMILIITLTSQNTILKHCP